MYLPINDLIFSFYAPTHLKQNKTKMNQKLVSSPQACARDIPKSFMFTAKLTKWSTQYKLNNNRVCKHQEKFMFLIIVSSQPSICLKGISVLNDDRQILQ